MEYKGSGVVRHDVLFDLDVKIRLMELRYGFRLNTFLENGDGSMGDLRCFVCEKGIPNPQ